MTAPAPTDPSHPTIALDDFIDQGRLAALIAAARAEDLGPSGRDLTSDLFIRPDQVATAVMRSRQAGVWCGGALQPAIAAAYDHALRIDSVESDGAPVNAGQTLARLRGPLRSLLAVERVALNFATHLSGIATLTQRFVDAIQGSAAAITDTRKTIPGLRGLAKYAVVCGGGRSHRMGLYDAVLIKDNHLAPLPPDQLANALADMADRARQAVPPPTFIEVEVDTLDQLRHILPCGLDIILLDNMDPPTLIAAVALRNELAPNVLLEASGGVTLKTVKAIAQTGVDRIAVGAITHSAPALDIGLDLID